MNDKEGRWKFHPHTADAKFEAYGATLEELFLNAGVACFEIITETEKIQPKKEYPITIEAKKLTSLLFDYLDELLFLLDTEGLVVGTIDDITIEKTNEGYSLSAIVKGDYHKNYDVSCNVKAVTYSDMELKTPEETGNGWWCMVVVDL